MANYYVVTGSSVWGRAFQANADVVGGLVTGSLNEFVSLPVDTGQAIPSNSSLYLSSSFGDNAASGSIIKALNFVMARADSGAEVTWTEVSSALGSADSNAYLNDDLIPKVDSSYDLGTSDIRWQYVYADAADIDGGNIDGTVIGASTAAAGTFTAGTFTSLTSSGNLVPSTDDAVDLGHPDVEFRNLYLDGVANIDSLVADTADIDGGTIDGAALGSTSAISALTVEGGTVSIIDTGGDGSMDGVVIGGTTPAAGTFTEVDSTSTINAGSTITAQAGLTGSGVLLGSSGQFFVDPDGSLQSSGTSLFVGDSTFGINGSSALFIAGVDAAGVNRSYRLAVSGGILRAEQQ